MRVYNNKKIYLLIAILYSVFFSAKTQDNIEELLFKLPTVILGESIGIKVNAKHSLSFNHLTSMSVKPSEFNSQVVSLSHSQKISARWGLNEVIGFVNTLNNDAYHIPLNGIIFTLGSGYTLKKASCNFIFRGGCTYNRKNTEQNKILNNQSILARVNMQLLVPLYKPLEEEKGIALRMQTLMINTLWNNNTASTLQPLLGLGASLELRLAKKWSFLMGYQVNAREWWLEPTGNLNYIARATISKKFSINS